VFDDRRGAAFWQCIDCSLSQGRVIPSLAFLRTPIYLKPAANLGGGLENHTLGERLYLIDNLLLDRLYLFDNLFDNLQQSTFCGLLHIFLGQRCVWEIIGDLWDGS